MRIKKVSEGAYFVPSYSVQTIVPFLPGITNQTITSEIEPRENIAGDEENTFTKEDFEKVLRKVSQPLSHQRDEGRS